MKPLIGGDGLGITAAHALNAPEIMPINGKIVMVAVDASSMATEAETLATYINQGKLSGEVNPLLTFINLAQPAKDINDWTNPERGQYATVWNTVNNVLAQNGLSTSDVQIALVKFEDLLDPATDPGRITRMFWQFVTCAQVLKTKFPNLSRCYLIGRSYMPTTDPKFGEPLCAYNEQSVKMVVQEQIAGNPFLDYTVGIVPWISDVINLYTDNYAARIDGYYRTPDSYKNDKVHPNTIGDEQVATYIYNALWQYTDFFAPEYHAESPSPYSDTKAYTPIPVDQYPAGDAVDVIDAPDNGTQPTKHGDALALLGLVGALLALRKKNKTHAK